VIKSAGTGILADWDENRPCESLQGCCCELSDIAITSEGAWVAAIGRCNLMRSGHLVAESQLAT